jgi:hypothetical protein
MDTGPLPALGYTPAGGRRYMANEQLPWLTPFSQQDAPGFAWRFQSRKARKGFVEFDLASLRLCESAGGGSVPVYPGRI